MQDNKRSNSSSYRKDVRIPMELWNQIKEEGNVSKFIIEAISEKIESNRCNNKTNQARNKKGCHSKSNNPIK